MSYLKDLTKKGAVFFRQQSKTYELAASTGVDPYDLIERYVADTTLHPADMVAAFLEEAGGKNLPDFSEAKGYNMPFGEDKQFRTRFVHAKDVGDALWEEIRADYEAIRNNPAKSYEGTLVYAICEDEAEINVARKAAKTIANDNVTLAVPHVPHPFTETPLRVKACRHYLPPNEAEKISAQTESRLRDIFENPEGAARLIYTLDGRDPRHSDSAQTTDNKLDLVNLLKGRPNVKVKIRAVDQNGNVSDPVSIELVSKERKYEIQVESDIFGEKGTFKRPDDTEGLVAVLKSIISYGVKKNLLSGDRAQKLETLLSDLAKDK